jgi:hypothetical protein
LRKIFEVSGRLVEIKNRHIRSAGYLLLIISIIVFLIGWLQWYIGIPASLFLIFAYLKIVKDMKEDQSVLSISKSTILLILFIIAAWVLLSGVGGAFPQKEDMNWRNAIFHDLIHFSWPVRYTDGFDSSLTYYIAFWMVPALFGKLAALIAGAQAGWIVANAVTAIYCITIIFVVMLLLIRFLNSASKRKMLLVLTILILFSGMDIVPIVIDYLAGAPIHHATHLEWWTYIEYSSNTSQLGWVYNQAIPTWLVMGLLIHEKKINHYAFLGLLLLPFGPLPFLGVLYLMIFTGIKKGTTMIQEGHFKEIFPQIFSLPNLIGCMTILPIFFLYFSSNATSKNNNGYWNTFDAFQYFEFVLVEFVIILILIWRDSYKKPFFISSAIGLFFIPLFKFGGGQDFCMRVSIPLLFVVMLYTMNYLLNHTSIEENQRPKLNKRVIPLIIVLLIGAATPLDEYRASYLQFKESGGHCTSIYADKFKTLNNGEMERDNFITKNASDTFFYRYLAKGEK